MDRRCAGAGVAILALLLSGCSGPSVRAGQGAGALPLAEVLVVEGLVELAGALRYVDRSMEAGLEELLTSGQGQWTIFGPGDAAFEEFYRIVSEVRGAPVHSITDVPAPVVLDLVRYHLAPGRRSTNGFVPLVRERTVRSVMGETFGVRRGGVIRDGLSSTRGGPTIVAGDLAARNGVLHVVDRVLIPPAVVGALLQ